MKKYRMSVVVRRGGWSVGLGSFEFSSADVGPLMRILDVMVLPPAIALELNEIRE